MLLRSNDLNVLPFTYLYPFHFSEGKIVMILYQINSFILELFCSPSHPRIPFLAWFRVKLATKQFCMDLEGRKEGAVASGKVIVRCQALLPGTVGAHVLCCSFVGASFGGGSRLVHSSSSNYGAHSSMFLVLHCVCSSINKGSKLSMKNPR